MKRERINTSGAREIKYERSEGEEIRAKRGKLNTSEAREINTSEAREITSFLLEFY